MAFFDQKKTQIDGWVGRSVGGSVGRSVGGSDLYFLVLHISGKLLSISR